MSPEKQRRSHLIFLGYATATSILIALAVRYYEFFIYVYQDPEMIRAAIAEFGILGPFVLVLAQIFQVIIFVIPGPVMTIAAGYAFGTFWGFLYSFIGTYIGSLFVFFLGRKYGRPFVERFVRPADLARYDGFIERHGRLALLLCRVAPIIIPNDAVSFAASVSGMRWRDYAGISFIGFIPNILLIALFGDRITEGFSTAGLVLLSVVGMSLVVYLLWHPVRETLGIGKKEAAPKEEASVDR